VQRAGALFTLTALGRYELATNLAWQMFITDKLDPHSFTTVLNRVLIGGSDHEKEEAAALLYYHHDKLITPDGFSAFPDCFMRWEMSLPDYVKLLGALTLGRLVTKRPHSEWKDVEVDAIIGALALGWCKETDKKICNEVGAILKAMVQVFPQERKLFHPECRIDMPEICKDIDSLEAKNVDSQEVIRELETWAAKQNQGEEEDGATA
jgi:hypothetical protein